MATNPWGWREGENPYRTTPFQVLGLGVTVKGRAAIEAEIRRRRQRVESAPERFRLFGAELDVAAVNEAAGQIRDPEARLYAELQTHRPRIAPALDLSDIASRVAALPPIEPDSTLSLDSGRLARFVPPPSPRRFDPVIEW